MITWRSLLSAVPPRLGEIFVLGPTQPHLLLRRPRRAAHPQQLASRRRGASSPQGKLCSLIDMDLETSLPDSSYRISKFVVWTASPSESRWQYFLQKMPWLQTVVHETVEYKRNRGCNVQFLFLSPFVCADLGKRSDRLGCAHDQVIARMNWCGPVARDLFQGDPPTDQHVNSNILRALSHVRRRRSCLSRQACRCHGRLQRASPRARRLRFRIPCPCYGCKESKDCRDRRDRDELVATMPLPRTVSILHFFSRRQARRRGHAPLSHIRQTFTSGYIRWRQGRCDSRAPWASRPLHPKRRPFKQASVIPPSARKLPHSERDGRDDAETARPPADHIQRHR
ncbi:hypothetical protein C8R47DRAFT_676400 [Mycena vitilis]|nr:hypothetical protein C8R47DRAFT_676400 [Mycena vitilis]